MEGPEPVSGAPIFFRNSNGTIGRHFLTGTVSRNIDGTLDRNHFFTGNVNRECNGTVSRGTVSRHQQRSLISILILVISKKKNWKFYLLMLKSNIFSGTVSRHSFFPAL